MHIINATHEEQEQAGKKTNFELSKGVLLLDNERPHTANLQGTLQATLYIKV